MSAVLEQFRDDLKFLIGSKITGVRKFSDRAYGEAFECMEITVRFPETKLVDGHRADVAVVQVWEDPEGNGPGFLALTQTGLDLGPSE